MRYRAVPRLTKIAHRYWMRRKLWRRRQNIPVLLDGFVCTAAVAPLYRLRADTLAHALAAHVSAEAGHRALLDELGLKPLVDLNMRLGEASGAALAVLILRAARAVRHCEPTGPARSGRPDDRLREAIQCIGATVASGKRGRCCAGALPLSSVPIPKFASTLVGELRN